MIIERSHGGDKRQRGDPRGLVETEVPAQGGDSGTFCTCGFQPIDQFRVDRSLILATIGKVVPDQRVDVRLHDGELERCLELPHPRADALVVGHSRRRSDPADQADMHFIAPPRQWRGSQVKSLSVCNAYAS